MKKWTLAMAGFVAFPAVLLAGCAATPYQPASASAAANGYSDTMVSENTYKVSFKGNDMTSRATVDNYLTYRAAQLAKQKGYTGFMLVKDNTSANDTIDVMPTAGVGLYPEFSPYYNFYGPFGSYYWNPWDGMGWDNSVDVMSSTNYDAHATIRLTNATGGKNYFNASDVMARLGSSIKMPK